MKKLFRFTIRKKVVVLTATLSVALILVSVTIASGVFSSRIKNRAKALSSDSADALGEYLSAYTMSVAADGSTELLMDYYIEKIDAIYTENREEIEQISSMPLGSDEALAEKKEYFNVLTTGVFANGVGFGASYSAISLKNSYAEITEEMERMTSLDGFVSCKAFYYDAEHNNIIFLFDSSSENEASHCFPCSVMKAPEHFVKDVYPAGDVIVITVGGKLESYAPVRSEGKTVAYVTFEYSSDSLIEVQREFLRTLIGVMLAATVALLLFYLLLANRLLVKNVKKLSAAARAFTSHMENGKISPVNAEIKTQDEIKDLSDDFFALQNKVMVYSDDIARKRAQEERMQAELAIASKIQMQSLPDEPLALGDVRVSSFIKPAKEVGGDLFDYFVTDEGKLFFTIADVSGKGVPAALFMMRGKEIIRSCAKAGMSAGRIAQTANRELCLNNKEGLFITAFIGVYDLCENKLTFARAGHEQPFLLRRGKAERFGEESNLVLGVFDDVPFEEDGIVLEDGDRLLLYTDGLNEGINGRDEEFGYERIKAALESADGDILGSLYKTAFEFADGAEQFDDITMLLFEKGKSVNITLEPPAYHDIPEVTDKINGLVSGRDPDKIAELDVIIDEIINNCVSYAFEGVGDPRLDIEARISDGTVQLVFTDNGVLFDPLKAETPEPESERADLPEGGLGIMFVKTMADNVSYRVFKGRNQLTVTKTLD